MCEDTQACLRTSGQQVEATVKQISDWNRELIQGIHPARSYLGSL